MAKETCLPTQKRPIHLAKETYLPSKTDLCTWQKRPNKRGLFTWQKRPIYLTNETYSPGKRDLFTSQKRPNHMAKETYLHGKRDLDKRDL